DRRGQNRGKDREQSVMSHDSHGRLPPVSRRSYRAPASVHPDYARRQRADFARVGESTCTTTATETDERGAALIERVPTRRETNPGQPVRTSICSTRETVPARVVNPDLFRVAASAELALV